MKTFLSYSSPIRHDQQLVLLQIEQVFAQQNNSYEKIESLLNISNPIYPIIDAVRICDNMVCLAFEKCCINKQGQRHFSTSQWVDIEAALAVQLCKPLLILREAHIDDSPLITHNVAPCKIVDIKTVLYQGEYQIDVIDFEHNIKPQLEYWLKTLAR